MVLKPCQKNEINYLSLNLVFSPYFEKKKNSSCSYPLCSIGENLFEDFFASTSHSQPFHYSLIFRMPAPKSPQVVVLVGTRCWILGLAFPIHGTEVVLFLPTFTLGIQSYSQLMIGLSNHLLSIVFRFHYHSQKVIGSLGLVGSWLKFMIKCR